LERGSWTLISYTRCPFGFERGFFLPPLDEDAIPLAFLCSVGEASDVRELYSALSPPLDGPLTRTLVHPLSGTSRSMLEMQVTSFLSFLGVFFFFVENAFAFRRKSLVLDAFMKAREAQCPPTPFQVLLSFSSPNRERRFFGVGAPWVLYLSAEVGGRKWIFFLVFAFSQ